MTKSMFVTFSRSRDTDQKLWADEVTHTPHAEVDLFTLRHLSSLTLISGDLPVAVDQEQISQ